MSDKADRLEGLDECVRCVLDLSTILGDWIITGRAPHDVMEQLLAMHFRLTALLPEDEQHPKPGESA